MKAAVVSLTKKEKSTSSPRDSGTPFGFGSSPIGGVGDDPRFGGGQGANIAGGGRVSGSPAPVAGIPSVPSPIPGPTLPPPGTPLDELLNKPLRTPPPTSPFAELLKKPRLPTLGEVVIKAKRLRPRGGRGNLSLLGFLLRLVPLSLFPSPIGDQPDDPADFGEKFPGREPPGGAGQRPRDPEAFEPPLGTVTVKAPRARLPERPPKIGTPDLIGLPVAFFPAPFPIKPKTSPFPSSKKRKGTVELTVRVGKEPKKITLPFPLPFPFPAPAPAPRPQPGPKILPSPGGISPPSSGQKVCSCRIVDPAKKKKKRKKKEVPEAAELEVEYTQGKQKVKVEGKVEKFCISRRVPIPKLSEPGVKITRKGVKVTGVRKTRIIRKCF